MTESVEMHKSTDISFTSAKRSCLDGILSPSAQGDVVGKYELCHKQMELLTWWEREPILKVIVLG